MDNEDLIGELLQKILHYDQLDLISKLGALQLCPENADQVLRIEFVCHLVNCLDYEEGKPKISRKRFDELLNHAPLKGSDIHLAEDPTPNLFSETLTFFDGSYVVFPGQFTDITFILRNLLSTIFLSGAFSEEKGFKNIIYEITSMILLLSDEIAKRVGVERYIEPKFSDGIFIPLNLKVLQSKIIFTEREIIDLFKKMGLQNSIFSLFVQQTGAFDINGYSVDNNPLQERPILKFDDNYIVAQPLHLLTALVIQILNIAKRDDHLSQLSDSYLDSINDNVQKSLDRFGFTKLQFTFSKSDDELHYREHLFLFDTNKVACVFISTDDFFDYSGGNLFDYYQKEEYGELLNSHLTSDYYKIKKEFPDSAKILFLLVFQGVGRGIAVGLPCDELNRMCEILALSAAEIEILSFLYGSEQLLLYKFAIARDRVRDQNKVLAFSTIDEFEFYRSNGFCYYADDHKYDGINILPGTGIRTRIDYVREFDPHAVPFFLSRGYVDVINLNGSIEYPIYAPVAYKKNPNGWYVEIEPVCFWVLFDRKYWNNQDKFRPNPINFLQFVTYWIWQFRDSIQNSVGVTEICEQVLIEIRLDNLDDWKIGPRKNSADDDFIDIKIESLNKLIVLFRPKVINCFVSPSNSGELIVINKIFEKVGLLLKNLKILSTLEKYNNELERFIKKNLSIPNKKMLIALDPRINPILSNVNLINFRKIQKADINIILDEIGSYAINHLGLKYGSLPKDEQNSVINAIVGFLYKNLVREIQELSPLHLIEYFVSHYEATLQHRESRRITITTQLACYSTIDEMVKRLSEEVVDFDEAALACRFIVEYLIASPPSGTESISLEKYDRLLALSSQIINYGLISDSIINELFEFNFAILESGRLGFNRDKYQNSLNSFHYSKAKESIFDAQDEFEGWWKDIPEARGSLPPLVEEMNEAFRVDFNVEFLEIVDFLLEIINLSNDNSGLECRSLEFSLFVSTISKEMSWGEEKTKSVIEILLLSPRRNFLCPQEPYTKRDVYPWRFNRNLSYLRRPLLLSVREGKNFVYWGMRHLYASLQYLIRVTMNGQLQYEHQGMQMKKFIGKVNNQKGEDFNQQVFVELSKVNDVVVDKKVRKISSVKLGYPNNDLGDVDVVLISLKKKAIFVVECKDLEIARNPHEMATELSELFNDKENKKSIVTKHTARILWIKENVSLVLRNYGISGKGKWKVEGAIIVKSEMITPHFYKSKIPIFTLREFIDKNL